MTEPVISKSGGVLPKPPGWRRWRPLLLGILLLGSGMLIGAGATLLVVRETVVYALHHPQEVPGRLANRLKGKLGLNEEQTSKVLGILTKHQTALSQIRTEFQPRVEIEFTQVRQEISEVLTGEQVGQWKNWFDHMYRIWVPPIHQSVISQ